jgi:protoheme IX farnesyltransferase
MSISLYVEMARPRVLALVLFTGLPVLGMVKLEQPDPLKIGLAMLATILAGAASSTLNAWMERETDARMARTRSRPLPAAAVAPAAALRLGVVLTVLSTLLLAWGSGWLAAVIGLSTILFYVVIYTWWLKPRTPQNIVIGGAAGATTPFIAEAALTGQLSVASLILFAIVFLWTPPHFWAIAIFRKEDYAAAGFPMMPNIIGNQATRRQSVVYTVAMTLATLAPVGLGLLGLAYGAVALLAGLWFLASVLKSIQADNPKQDYQVFRDSIIYLFAIFAMMLVDLAIYPIGYLF